jgi:hypothetical protein
MLFMNFEQEVESLPDDELYWKKTELEDEEFKVERKMRKAKSARKQNDYLSQVKFIVAEISMIEDHMASRNL